jgi:hypothetical protein
MYAVTGSGRAAVRGQRFNALLADVLRRDGLDAVSDQRGLDGDVLCPTRP